MKKTIEQRFWEKVGPHDDPAVCWIWQGGKHDGHSGLQYDAFWVEHKIRVLSHRFSFLSLVGPIPEGLELDHKCRNTLCVNPAHMELVTHKINCLRGVGVGAVNTKKEHCPQGHPYSTENTYVYRGGRYCRTCSREKFK